MKKILITGGTGFLGKNLSYKLKKNYKIFVCSRNLDNGINIRRNLNVEFIPLNISKYSDVDEVLFNVKPDVVIHAAASKFVDLSEKFVSETVDTNILGSKNVILCSRKYKCKKFIVISSDKASPPFTNLYGISKATMEQILISINSDKKQDLNIVRFGNLAWSTGSVLNQWNEMRKQKKIIKTTGPEMTRFFYSINNAVKLIENLLNNNKRFNNKVIIPEMKSLWIRDMLVEFCTQNKVKWKKIEKRKMDKPYETLISSNQKYKKIRFKNNNEKIFIIDLKSNEKSKNNEEINSLNSKKFSKKEIIDIINKKPKYL